jgi:hypothetical protein
MFDWGTIRSLVQSKAAAVMAVVFGLLPSLALLHTAVLAPLGFGPFSTWMKITYFSSLMYWVASAIYAIGAPPLVKKYADSNARVEAEFASHERSHPAYRLEVTLAQVPIGDPVRRELADLDRQRLTAPEHEQSQLAERIASIVNIRWPDTVQQYLARTYEEALESRPALRLLFAAVWLLGMAASVTVIVHRVWLVFSA